MQLILVLCSLNYSLKKLNLSNLKTNKVTNMAYMFFDLSY